MSPAEVGGRSAPDGRHEAKASAVGREFSRGNLEKRFGRYPDYRARMAVANALAPPRQVAFPARDPPQAEPAASLPAAEPAPEPTDSLSTAEPQLRAHPRVRPQFGDAGHGIAELFGASEAPSIGRPAPAAEQPAPVELGTVLQPQQAEDPQLRFLREIQERATPVLRRARSWAELERALADHGLSLRVKGGGFVVTDGEREVKASDIGRPFSRFHLEKRLGLYSDTGARATTSDTPAPEAATPQPEPPPVAIARVWSQPPPAPEPRKPAIAPEPAEVRPERPVREVVAAEQQELPFAHPADPTAPVTQPQQLALPLPAPDVQEAGPSPRAPRFTLYEQYEAFGVYDSVGPQLFFAETRERALAEVERANKIAEAYPDVISMRHLREMDDAWRDARGLPRLPEPEGRRITVPAPEGLEDGPPSPPPVAPTPASAAPEPGPPSQPIRGPEPTQPARQAVAATPFVPQPPEPAAPAVRRLATPRRTRSQPPTHRDNYREVVWSFRQKLAELYRDPRAARRAFDVELGRHGAESAVRVLAEAPEQYGKLQILALRERIVAAVPWAELYVDWQRGSIRPARYAAADLLEAAALPFWISDARGQVHAARNEHTTLPKRIAAAAAVEAKYKLGLKMVYSDPAAAELKIDAHCQLHGVRAAVKAIEQSPRLFGALCPNEDQSWISRQWNGEDTSAARERAKVLAEEFRAAQVAVRERPQSDALLRARTAVVDAERFAEALEAKLAALPYKNFTVYAAEALRVIDQAAAATGRSVDRIVDQVRPMLPKEAIQFARKALDAVYAEERRRERERSRGPGIGF